MADYFETDDVTREYDSRLVSRILSYLKPYRLPVLLSLAVLLVSTLGELLVPVLQQKIIDEDILARSLAVRADAYSTELSPATQAAYTELVSAQNVTRIGATVFVPLNRHVRISVSSEAELKDRRILDEAPWYVFSYTAGTPLAALVGQHPGMFLRDGNDNPVNENPPGARGAAIRTADIRTLPAGDISLIRGADISRIIRGAVILFAVLILVFLFTFLQTVITNRISQRVMKDMRLQLFQKTVSQSTAFLSMHPVGRVVTRLTGDVETINEFFTTVLAAFLKDLSIMTGALVTLFILSPKMAAVVIATIPPVLILTLYSRVKARDAFRRQRTASSKVYAYLAERLAGVQVVQLFRRENKSAAEFKNRNRELLSANLGEMYVFAVFRPLVEWFATLTTAVVIVVGSKMVLSLSISLGVLIAFINLVHMFYAPVTDIAEKYTLLQSAMAGGERVFKLLDTNQAIPDQCVDTARQQAGAGQGGSASGTRPVDAVRGHIEFDNVRFSYIAGEEVLKGLTFSVKPGEMAAIVGYTGAGKTTIINVLTRLWDIDSGEIRLDGIPIKNIGLDDLRRAVLPVLQEVFLFSGTVQENISLGLGFSEEEIISAAQAVHAHEFISRLPDGYKTMLSEGAANISSGQRQLISFARVIAHNPRVIILDEATSSVDTETEHLIRLGIQRIMAGRTSIIIAHRLSTIRHADRILALSSGHLAEEGSHEELIAKDGLYAGLYKLQYADAGNGQSRPESLQ
jgi:ATP-binding cassette subfamily B protein